VRANVDGSGAHAAAAAAKCASCAFSSRKYDHGDRMRSATGASLASATVSAVVQGQRSARRSSSRPAASSTNSLNSAALGAENNSFAVRSEREHAVEAGGDEALDGGPRPRRSRPPLEERRHRGCQRAVQDGTPGAPSAEAVERHGAT
jgi:hypothetical protein